MHHQNTPLVERYPNLVSRIRQLAKQNHSAIGIRNKLAEEGISLRIERLRIIIHRYAITLAPRKSKILEDSPELDNEGRMEWLYTSAKDQLAQEIREAKINPAPPYKVGHLEW